MPLNIKTSSAYNLIVELMLEGKSFMNNKNRRGTSTVPCGTPDTTGKGILNSLSIIPH